MWILQKRQRIKLVEFNLTPHLLQNKQFIEKMFVTTSKSIKYLVVILKGWYFNDDLELQLIP